MSPADEPSRIGHLSRRELMVGGLLVATSAGAAGLAPQPRSRPQVRPKLSTLVPERFGTWVSRLDRNIVRPAEASDDASPYDEEITRVYARPDTGAPVMLVIAYGALQSDRLQLHRPEFCYPAAGFQIVNRRPLTFIAPGGRRTPASCFTARRDERVEQVFYWTRIGDLFPTSWLGQHSARIKSSIGGSFADGLLVRLSVLDRDHAGSLDRLQGFAVDLLRALPPAGQRALVGKAEP